MTDWHALRDAYGPADAVPALLDRVTPDAAHPAWNDLWSRLCHQGTVYPASFAALPRLEALARGWGAQERDPALQLAGAIVASTDRVDADGEPLRSHDDTLRSLEGLAAESLAAGGRSEEAFIFLLQAARGLAGDTTWGTRLDGLVDGELTALCPECETELCVVIGDEGTFVTAEEWVERPGVAREPIAPGALPLEPPGEWLRQQAIGAGHPDVARRIAYVFGASRCPSCEARIQIAEAVACAG